MDFAVTPTSAPVTAAPVTTPPAADVSPAPAPTPEVAGGGIQGVIGDLIRSTAAGYQQAAKMSGVQADKAAIVPFETVITGTSLLKDKTANIKGVSKVTGLLNTIAGFGMLIMSSNVSSTLRAPGETAVDIGNRVADLIDGKDTAQGWGIGWGIRSEGQESVSTLGSALGNAGMK